MMKKKLRSKTFKNNTDYFEFIRKHPVIKVINVTYTKKKEIKMWYEDIINVSKKKVLN